LVVRKPARRKRPARRPRAARKRPRPPARTRGGAVIPALRYRDAPAAIAWLCKAFGFTEHLVVPDGAGGIAHAQLKVGADAMVMLGSQRGDEFGRLVALPSDAGGRSTQSAYIVVADPDAHYARAKAAGAAIVYEIRSEDHGGRAYSCRDPEGHLWNFGSYDPWA
jgi:uncharacterized glyoxalase superfamily protein PhnB